MSIDRRQAPARDHVGRSTSRRHLARAARIPRPSQHRRAHQPKHRRTHKALCLGILRVGRRRRQVSNLCSAMAKISVSASDSRVRRLVRRSASAVLSDVPKGRSCVRRALMQSQSSAWAICAHSARAAAAAGSVPTRRSRLRCSRILCSRSTWNMGMFGHDAFPRCSST